jgi:hypothetical protein
MLIKFKKSGTARHVAEGVANQLLYHYAMHKATPSFKPNSPYADYWDLYKKMTDYFLPFVKPCETEYFFDETKSPMFKKVIESGMLTKVPKEYAVIKADPEHIGLMNMWGQIIGDKGSTREIIKIDVKSRIQTLKKHKIDFEVNGNQVSGLFPYGVIHCAEVYGLLVEKPVIEKPVLEEPEDKLW